MKKAISMLCVLALTLTMLLTGITKAEACTSAYSSWSWSSSIDTQNFTVRMCSSDFYHAVTAKTCVFVWNNISSKVNIKSYSYGGDTTDNQDDINIHSVELTGTTAGQTHIYTKVLGIYVEADFSGSSSKIVQARINLNPDLLSRTSELKEKVIIHEIGHALGLRHPLEVNCYTKCVMQQNTSGYESATIEQHDKNNLITKWGK